MRRARELGESATSNSSVTMRPSRCSSARSRSGRPPRAEPRVLGHRPCQPGSVYLARGNWPAGLYLDRQAIRLLVGQDTSFTIIKSIVERISAGIRDTFVGLCRAAWQTRADPGTSKAGLVEETFTAGQHAWHTSAAAALAKMTARLGASDTELGRRIRRCRTCRQGARAACRRPEAAHRLEPCSGQTPPTARPLDEFRAASIARDRDKAPRHQAADGAGRSG